MRIPTVTQPLSWRATVGPLATNAPSPPPQGQGWEEWRWEGEGKMGQRRKRKATGETVTDLASPRM